MELKRPAQAATSQATVVPLAKRMKTVNVIETSPSDYAEAAFRANGFDTDDIIEKAYQKFYEPTTEELQAYTFETSRAVRDNDLARLQQLNDKGVLLDCCNRFGDSLLHIACRRGHTETVKFLVEEVQVTVNRLDDLRRTPLHDACWTSEPNFEIVNILIQKAPEHVLLRDNRGHTPFDYARKAHWESWVKFLSERSALFRLDTTSER